MPETRILAVNGSERGEKGTTFAVLQHCAELAQNRGMEFKTLNLADYSFSSCGPCGNCNTRTEMCSLQDEAPKIVAELTAADAVILASPVQGFATVPLMSAFIERIGVGYLRFGRPLTNKVGAAIVVGRRYGHTDVYSHLISNVLLNRMIVAGAGFPPTVYAGSPEEIAQDPEGMDMVDRAMFRLMDLVELLQKHQALTRAPAMVPESDNERSRVWSETAGDRSTLLIDAAKVKG